MSLLYGLLMTLLFILIVLYIFLYLRFQRSSYRHVSRNSFFKTYINKGFWGEYRIFATLEKLAKPQHILTNLYIPRKDGTTTEIDLVYLTSHGIFVIESKNYSGWIFGNEKQKYWTQTFENKQKFRFFNPIWQNTTHINALKEVLPEELHQQLHSLIVFNNQATLKKVTVTSENIHVIKREELKSTLNKFNKTTSASFSLEQLSEIANLLSVFMHPNEQVKAQHITAIQAKKIR